MTLAARLDSLDNGAKSHAPAVIFSNQDDRIVPARFQNMVADQYAGPKRLVKVTDAGHNDVPDPEDTQVRRAMDWLWSKL